MPDDAPVRSGTMKLSVVSPVYSEEESVREVVQALASSLQGKLHQVILVISPDSTPGSKATCQKLSQDFPFVEVHVQRENPGLGRAVRQGFEHVTGTHVLLIDSDGEMDPATAPSMVQKMEGSDYDLVIGSRWAKGGGVEGYDPLKYFLNRGFQYLFRLLFWTGVHDLTLGYKLMKVEVVRSLRWSSDFHEFGIETTLLPIRVGYRAAEVPTVWRKRRQGSSKNRWGRNFRYAGKALEIWWNGKKALKRPG